LRADKGETIRGVYFTVERRESVVGQKDEKT